MMGVALRSPSRKENMMGIIKTAGPYPAVFGRERRGWLSILLVEPGVLEAPAVVDAVDHQRHALDMGLHAGGTARMEHDRPRPVLLQLLVDVPDQLLALLLVDHHRLLDEF